MFENKLIRQLFQDSAKTFESIVTVDWENGFVETSAKDNLNVSQVFKELLTQAKVCHILSIYAILIIQLIFKK